MKQFLWRIIYNFVAKVKEKTMAKKKILCGMLVMALAFVSGGLFAQQPVVAVAPFDAISGISSTEANMITRVFFIRLGNTNKVSLVDRSVVERVLREHSFQAGDWSDQKKTAELGTALNADWIVRGEMEKFGSNILVTVQFYDIRTFRFMGGADLRLANADEAYDKMDPLVDKLVDTIATSGGGTRQSAPGTRPATSGTYKIGDKGPGGGTIFFARDGKYRECSGELGTSTIVWRLANQLALNYDGGGFTDWRLPTREELDLMYINLRLRGLGGFDTTKTDDNSDASGYWSSESGWIQNFATGRQSGRKPDDFVFRTRAVRSF
jgi:TolB-like protein